MSGREKRGFTRRATFVGFCALAWPTDAFAVASPFDDRFVTYDPPVPMSSAVLHDRSGRPIRFSPRPGRPGIVVVWASWCAACRQDMPKLARAAQDFRRSGLEIAAVNVEDLPLETVLERAATIETGSLPLYFDRGGRTLAAASTGGHRSAFQPLGMPVTFFYDRMGLVRGYVRGSIAWSADLAMPIAAWL